MSFYGTLKLGVKNKTNVNELKSSLDQLLSICCEVSMCSWQDECACDEGPQCKQSEKIGFHNLKSMKDSSDSMDRLKNHFRG